MMIIAFAACIIYRHNYVNFFFFLLICFTHYSSCEMGSEFALSFQALKTRWSDMNFIFFSYIISFSLCHYHHHHLWFWLIFFFQKEWKWARILIAYARFSSDRNLDSGSQRQRGGKIERNKRKTLRKNERERKRKWERTEKERKWEKDKEEDQREKREQGASPPAAAQASPGGRAATQPRPPSFLR